VTVGRMRFSQVSKELAFIKIYLLILLGVFARDVLSSSLHELLSDVNSMYLAISSLQLDAVSCS